MVKSLRTRGIGAWYARSAARSVLATLTSGMLFDMTRFPGEDAGSLAAAIAALVQDPVRRAEAGLRGREIAVSEFSSGRIAHDTLVVYRELLLNRAAPAAVDRVHARGEFS